MQIYYAKTNPARYAREPNVVVGLWLWDGTEHDVANAQVRLEREGYTILTFDRSARQGRRLAREIMLSRYRESAR